MDICWQNVRDSLNTLVYFLDACVLNIHSIDVFDYCLLFGWQTQIFYLLILPPNLLDVQNILYLCH